MRVTVRDIDTLFMANFIDTHCVISCLKTDEHLQASIVKTEELMHNLRSGLRDHYFVRRCMCWRTKLQSVSLLGCLMDLLWSCYLFCFSRSLPNDRVRWRYYTELMNLAFSVEHNKIGY